MAASQRLYVALAKALKDTSASAATIEEVSKALAADNPRFKPEKFRAAASREEQGR